MERGHGNAVVGGLGGPETAERPEGGESGSEGAPGGRGRVDPRAGTWAGGHGRDEGERVPAGMPGSGTLERLAETAREYARSSRADATRRAYGGDWRRWTAWCARRGADPLAADPEAVGLWLADMASGDPPLSVATVERRLSGLCGCLADRGMRLDRADRHVASVLAGIRRRHGRPPRGKAALSAGDILAMAAFLPMDLRGIRDRAMLLLGFAGGFRRSELVGLDAGRGGPVDGTGWVEVVEDGLLATLRGKTGWREVAVGRGSRESSCPVAAVETWTRLGRVDAGALFRRVSRDGLRALPARLSDRHVAELVRRTALAAGIRPDLPERERAALFSGHSLRAGLATAARADEAAVQAHLGHASADMTRRYQRDRDRWRVNLTKAAGL